MTGQTLSAAEKQVRGEVKPSADAIGAMIAAFGVPFIVAVFPASRNHLSALETGARAQAALRRIAEIVND